MKKILVLIDAGHGENTPGKCSPDNRVKEWAWTREIASMLQDRLNNEGIENMILVPESKDIALSTRVARANKVYKDRGNNKKDTFVVLLSIHINAAGNSGWHAASGWSGWISPTASQSSKTLAQCLYKECEELKLQGNRYVPKEKYWTAAYYIVKNTKMPAVLTENLFMDNKQEVDYLLSAEGKQAIVDLHANAIKNFMTTL